MPQLQELITRARFLLSGAPKRLEVFKLINGKRTARDIAIRIGRDVTNTLHDIEKFRAYELVTEKKNKEGEIEKRHGSTLYEKVPLVKHISHTWFQDVSQTTRIPKKNLYKQARVKKLSTVHIPSEQEILDICREGESQLYEFKLPGTAMDKITKEIAAFLHTKSGGILFYGIDDDGSIIGSDLKRQEFDQRLQNSIRNTIEPQPNIDIRDRNVMGTKIILVVIPPWDRKILYWHKKTEKSYIRRGTNVFALKPEETKNLLKGEYVI